MVWCFGCCFLPDRLFRASNGRRLTLPKQLARDPQRDLLVVRQAREIKNRKQTRPQLARVFFSSVLLRQLLFSERDRFIAKRFIFRVNRRKGFLRCSVFVP